MFIGYLKVILYNNQIFSYIYIKVLTVHTVISINETFIKITKNIYI